MAKKKSNNTEFWKNATILLATLLVVSVFTYGFRGAAPAAAPAPQAAPAQAAPRPAAQPTTLKTPTSAARQDPGRVQVSADDDPSIGPADAKVTIIEFSDFECPFCGRAAPTIRQVLEAYEGKVRLVYRDFPLSFHRNAQKAAEAAECADDQGLFWEYHDKLFENQASLGVESLKAYAVELGLDAGEFNDCLDSGKHAPEVQNDFSDGRAAGVGGTPAFFINGIKVSGAQPFQRFAQIIDSELGGGGA